MAVRRSASICRSASGNVVSSFSSHLVFLYFDQSTANGGLKLERMVLLVWKPPSIAWRKPATILSASSAAITPCAASLSAYSLRVPGCALMILYISGCVTIGSSCSLWPSLRKQTISTTTSFLNWVR